VSRTISSVTALIILYSVASYSAAVAQSSPSKLPDGEGKEVTERICAACHAIETVVTERHTKAEWQKISDDMVARGADATDADVAVIVQYLIKNFGPKASSLR
jgi:cytochrome c5